MFHSKCSYKQDAASLQIDDADDSDDIVPQRRGQLSQEQEDLVVKGEAFEKWMFCDHFQCLKLILLKETGGNGVCCEPRCLSFLSLALSSSFLLSLLLLLIVSIIIFRQQLMWDLDNTVCIFINNNC